LFVEHKAIELMALGGFIHIAVLQGFGGKAGFEGNRRLSISWVTALIKLSWAARYGEFSADQEAGVHDQPGNQAARRKITPQERAETPSRPS